MIKYILANLFLGFTLITNAQGNSNLKDSTEARVHSSYNNVSKIHRKLFGENYRKEWAASTKLPDIKISEFAGGLTPISLGGGHQSHSLHLKDSDGAEWVLRTVEKFADGLAPELIKGSLYESWIDDNFSAQHPYSALIVPVLADAVNVPHTSPIIGVVAYDKALGEFVNDFNGKVCLLEKRDPAGDSDNTFKMLGKLDEDNDNNLDTATFFRARLLDLLIADWGRHEDQWRWADTKDGKGKHYMVVPRDRDQALYVNQGFLPKAASSVSALSFLKGFNKDYKNVNDFFFNGRKLNQQFLNQYTYDEWMLMTREFVSALPDEVLIQAVAQLPASAQHIRKEAILETLKFRRDNMPAAMDNYYRFLYRITDVHTSDKAELIQFNEDNGGKINLTIHKLSKAGEKEQLLYSNSFQPDITEEIRLFTGKGNDAIKVNVPTSDIKIKIVGGEGQKNYELKSAKHKVDVYENLDNDSFIDTAKQLNKHLSNDTLNTKKIFSDLYNNSSGFSPTVDLRSVDGLFLGLAYKIKREGFRKEPYGSIQKFSVLKSLGTKAIIFQYEAEWLSVFKNTDITVNGLADINGNILNFFGRGNDTFFDQSDGFRTFYRANFSFFQLEPAFRIHLSKNTSLSVGPAFQHFTFNPDNNEGRYINTPAIINQFDFLQEDKTHGGFQVTFNWDKRDNIKLPTRGLNFSIRVHGFEGLNTFSNAYAQVFPQISFYKSLNSKGTIVLANRTGAGFTMGETAFYQSAFLGSQDNLLGFRKYRFAGDNLVYNNLETRITLPNIFHYILPGKIGLIGFYDVGRVWVNDENSTTVHHGYGGGIFLAPLNRFFVRAVAGFSTEGMQPTIAVRQRF